jgi:hypothetical protein
VKTTAIHRALRSVVLAAALVSTATACGSLRAATAKSTATAKAPAGSAASNPLAGLSADQITSKAIADSEAAATVRISGRVADSGTTIGMNLGIVRGRGCAGSMSISGEGSFLILKIGKTLWFKPDNAFWMHAGARSPAELQLVSGKIPKTTSTSGVGAFAALCDVKQLMGGSSTTGLVKGSATTISGQSALQLTDTAHSGTIDVSVSADPELLRLFAPGSADLDFTGYGAPVALTPPPASEIIDGTKYGF